MASYNRVIIQLATIEYYKILWVKNLESFANVYQYTYTHKN